MSLLPPVQPWTREWFVEGQPAPGGSKNAFVPRRRDGSAVTTKTGHIVVNLVDAGGDRNKAWRKVVAYTARAFWRQAPAPGAIELQLIFFLRRPTSHYGTGRNAAALRADAPGFHAQSPDTTKLIRSTEDALKSIVWVDDCQVIKQLGEKRWASQHEKAGCIVRIRIL